MKIFVLAIVLLCCGGIIHAQQKLDSFEELYGYLEKEYIDKNNSFLSSLEEGMTKMCHYQNIQSVAVKQRLEPLAQRTGRSVSELFIDSMFNGVKTVLLPGKYAQEFRKIEKELQFFSGVYCNCASTAKGKTAFDKLDNLLDCFIKTTEGSPVWDSIMVKSYPSELKQLQNSLGAYVFIHCGLYSDLLKQHLYSAIPGDYDANNVDALLFEKMRALRGFWKRQSLDSLSGIFPGYEQYVVQLENALASAAKLKSEFEIKRNANKQPVLEYTFYTGKGNGLKIINRAAYTFSSNSASCVFSAVDIIPFEKIPGVKQLQQKMRENTRTDSKSIPYRPPQPLKGKS